MHALHGNDTSAPMRPRRGGNYGSRRSLGPGGARAAARSPGMIRGDPCIPRAAWQELLAIIRLARVLRGLLPAHWRYGLHSELLQAVAMGGQR